MSPLNQKYIFFKLPKRGCQLAYECLLLELSLGKAITGPAVFVSLLLLDRRNLGNSGGCNLMDGAMTEGRVDMVNNPLSTSILRWRFLIN